MKKIIFLFSFISLVSFCHAQNTSNIITSVKQEKGKVVFRDTVSSELSREEIQLHLMNWLNTKILPESGVLNANDTVQGIISCQMMDLLEMAKMEFYVFSMYLRYQLIFQCFDNQYILTVRNINFIDPADLMTDKNIPVQKKQISGEFVMLEKKYKVLTVKNASGKLTDAAIQRFNEVFGMARKALKVGKM